MLLGKARATAEPGGVHKGGNWVGGKEMLGEGIELASGIVGVGLPVGNGSNPVVVITGEFGEAFNEGVASFGTERGNGGLEDKEVGVLFGVEEEVEVGFSSAAC